jgi:dihydrofolate reductase
MGRIVVINHLTLDGVMQAPGRLDEDTRDGFAHGGWAQERNDPAMFARIGRHMNERTALLLGRRTYEHFHAFWPTQDHPFARALTQMPKHVATRTLSEPLPWENSQLFTGDAAALKAEHDGDIVIMGSGELIRSLIPENVIDEYLLMTHPIVLGEGRRMFAPRTEATLRLVDSQAAATGVVISTYRPA